MTTFERLIKHLANYHAQGAKLTLELLPKVGTTEIVALGHPIYKLATPNINTFFLIVHATCEQMPTVNRKPKQKQDVII